METTRVTLNTDITMGATIVAPPIEQDAKPDASSTGCKLEETTASVETEVMVKAKGLVLEQEEELPKREDEVESIRPGNHNLADVPRSEELGKDAQYEGGSMGGGVEDSATVAVGAQLTTWYKKSTKVLVGFAYQKAKLKKILSDGTDVSTKGQPKIVPIVGDKGIGKTALACAVYDELKPKYFGGAFVSVGQDPDVKRVFKDVLVQIPIFMEDSDFKDEKAACEYLRERLKDEGCYFVVFDDIPDLETWNKVKVALPENNYNGKVLVTTHDRSIFGNCDYTVMELGPLCAEDSKELLYRGIFDCTSKERFNKEHFGSVSSRIDPSKCCGVPLDILTLASQLACRPMNDWTSVSNSMHNQNDGIVSCIHDLPSNLKNCLLYLSVFPVDAWIEKDALIWKWIAEGYVQKENMKGLYEIGERYFNDLINKSLIQPVSRYNDKCFKEACRVHDIVLDQIRLLFSSQQISMMAHGVKQCKDLEGNAQRLCIEEKRIGWKQWYQAVTKMPRVWSLCAHRCDHIGWVVPFEGFRALRVLDLVCCSFGIMSYFVIGELQHLRYLGLAGTPILQISAENIGKHKSLQTLDLRRTGLQQLPSSIGQLRQLMCLWSDDRTRVLEGCIKNLTSLQDLQVYADNKSPNLLQELSSLPELRVLRIWLDNLNAKQERCFQNSLKALHKLKSLEIRCASPKMIRNLNIPRRDLLRSLSLEGIVFPRLPPWIKTSSAPNLSQLAVAVNIFEDSDMCRLGGLTELTSLNLVVSPLSIPPARCNKQDMVERSAFAKLRFCTTNAIPSIFLRPGEHSVTILRRLEVLQLYLMVKDTEAQVGIVLDLPCLEHVTILLKDLDASEEEAKEKVSELKKKANGSPNRPAIQVVGKNINPKDAPSYESPLFRSLLEPELAKMRTNLENLQRIQLHEELDKLDEELKNLQDRISNLYGYVRGCLADIGDCIVMRANRSCDDLFLFRKSSDENLI